MKVQNTQSKYPNSPAGRMKELKDALSQHPDVFVPTSDGDHKWRVTGVNGRRWDLYIGERGGSALEDTRYGNDRAFHMVSTNAKGFSVETNWAVQGESYLNTGRSHKSFTTEKLNARDQFTLGLKVLGAATGIPFDLYAPGLAARPIAAKPN